jgi:hypothetical protein
MSKSSYFTERLTCLWAYPGHVVADIMSRFPGEKAEHHVRFADQTLFRAAYARDGQHIRLKHSRSKGMTRTIQDFVQFFLVHPHMYIGSRLSMEPR